MIDQKRKSNLDKGQRKTLPIEIEAYNKKNNFPAPSHYKPDDKLTTTAHKACLNFKEPRIGFFHEAMFRGATSPVYYSRKYELVEDRIRAPKYKAPGKHDKAGPAFLREERATKLIAPSQYETN